MKHLHSALLLLFCLAIFSRAQERVTNSANTSCTAPDKKCVCVLGNVIKPGWIPLAGQFTVTAAIEKAGGMRADDKSRYARVWTSTIGSNLIHRRVYVDLKAVLKHSYMDLELENYDIVEVLPTKKNKQYLLSISPCFAAQTGVK